MYHKSLQPELQNGAIMSGAVYRAILCIICECSCLEESVKEGRWETGFGQLSSLFMS